MGEVKILLYGIYSWNEVLSAVQDDDSSSSRIAHTAEHAFIGALQNLLGQTLRVRKVEHKNAMNTAFIAIQDLDLETIVKAEQQVNSLISQGRKISARTFASLEEARKNVPNLRANEERISGEVRVIEIERHDVAACAMEHAENLSECDFFLATRLSRSGDECEVDFAVGRQAKEIAISLSARLLRVCSELGANANTVENTARKLRSENESNAKKLRALSREKLAGIVPEGDDKITLFKGAFSGLSDDMVQEFAGAKISGENVVVLISNAGESDMASFVLARSEKMQELDCNKLFRQHAGADGKGGGKPHFVTGVVKKEAAGGIIEKISDGILHRW